MTKPFKSVITDEERVNASVQQLEYSLADGLSKLIYPREKKIAVMRGNGELPDSQIADFVKTIQEYYFMAPFTLDSAAISPQNTLKDLMDYDLILEPKPTQPYSENEKYVLDQYLMNGGNILWLAEVTNMETDSLFNERGTAIALPRDLNPGDQFPEPDWFGKQDLHGSHSRFISKAFHCDCRD